MNEIEKLILSRRSIREYQDKKIPLELIKKIIKMGLYAPSSCNQQLYNFILLEDDAIKQKIVKEANFKILGRIPTPIFVICDKRFGRELFANIQSAAAAIENMLLYAHSIGLGGLWMCGVGNSAVIKKILKIPDHYHLVACVGFGYPKEHLLAPEKRSPGDVLCINKFYKPEPKSLDPDSWGLEAIQDLATRAISAHSPAIGYRHLFNFQLQKEISFVSKFLGQTNLSIWDVTGIYTLELAQTNKDKSFIGFCHSKKIASWLNRRAKFLELNNVKFLSGRLGDIKQKKIRYYTLLGADE